jgi:hypothetical protein
MLQVLCQILQTENINEIQSWLVSSGPSGLFCFYNTYLLISVQFYNEQIDPLFPHRHFYLSRIVMSEEKE